jgi:hypothetical protein
MLSSKYDMENIYSEIFISVKRCKKVLQTKGAGKIGPYFINLNKGPR